MHLKDNKGFTLVEVVASLAIITMILLFFSGFFVQNNNVSVRNTEKLIVVNLADAYLERMRIERKEEVDYQFSSYPKSFVLNDRSYSIKLENKTTEAERQMKLVNLLVKVTAQDGKTVGEVEGYADYD